MNKREERAEVQRLLRSSAWQSRLYDVFDQAQRRPLSWVMGLDWWGRLKRERLKEKTINLIDADRIGDKRKRVSRQKIE